MKAAILLVVLQLAIGAKLPENFKRCHLKDPHRSSCLEAAVVDALRKMGTTGIPSLNVEPLQPMVVKEVKVDQGSKGPVSVKLQLTNLKIYGIPESNIESFRLSGHEMKAKSLTPEVKLDADYVLEGQLLLLPIRGKGTCTITLESVTTLHDIKGKLVSRDGETYLEMENYEIKLSTKQMSLIFRNLFNGDKNLGETLNKVMNENWELIFNELRPALEKAFGEVFLKYTKGIFDKVAYNDIFLE